MKHPPFLQKNDQIALVATARKISVESLQPALQMIENWGLNPILGKTISSEKELAAEKENRQVNTHQQFAGIDEERIADFQKMLDNPEIKAILCARGGYGTARILDKLNFNSFQENPKWIIGYSDITALHSHLHTHFNCPTIHASMPISFPENTPEALESLRKMLFGEAIHYDCEAHLLNRVGEGRGQVVGGNLSLLYSLIGSPSDINTDGKILFLEDLDEYLYHIDRMMLNLKRSGKLQNLAALLVGGMTDMNDNETPFGKNACEIIAEHTADYDYPILFNCPAGHIDNNCALMMGAEAIVKVENDRSNISFIHPENI